MLDILQDSYELTDDQAVFTILMSQDSQLCELDSALSAEKKKFFMVSGVKHPLWQQISSDGRLENIQVCFARFLEARDNFAKFQAVLDINLLPSDAVGLLSLVWPATFKDIKEVSCKSFYLDELIN